ncbi:uncharacterized protein LOC116333741 [Oreochromis aureus]|uniref:uncharacterized protein LOC116333741 n=1 Tax=Oreochromis aureus TaxID=47969 RepID=UPI0019547043|nr:uncharacterized protein LOC116333741 [Oreochromis aureus]
MVNFNLISFLLYTLSWISVSLAQFYTVAVEPGQQITLQCSNFSSFATYIFWFRLADRLNASRISFMSTANSHATFCDGFQYTKFNMISNTSVLFLEIKQVDPSDSGLYFCGELHMGRPSVFTATYLKVQEDGLTSLSTVILGSLIAFLLLIIIGLVVRIRKLHTAHDEMQNLPHSENVESDVKITAGLSFHLRKRVPQRELETNVVYAAMSTK